MVVRLSILFCIFIHVGWAQIPLDSITLSYFEKDKLALVAELKERANKQMSPSVLYDLGEIYEDINREDSAAKYYDWAFEKYKSNKDNKGKLKVLPSLISLITAQNLHNFDAASYKKTYWDLIQNEPKYGLHYTIYKKLEARGLIRSDSIDKALKILYTLKNKSKPQDSLNLYSTILIHIGLCHKIKEKYPDSAKYYYQKSLNIDKISKTPNALFYNYINQGNFCLQQKDYKNSLAYYDSANMFPPQKYQLKNYRLLYLCYSDIYHLLGDDQKSFTYLKAHNKLDSLINEKQQNQGFYEIETKYNLTETQKQITVLKKFVESYKRHKIYYITGLVLTFLLSLYSFLRWKKVDQKRRKIEQERNRIRLEKEQTSREKELAEREKEHLAKEKELVERQKLEKEKEVNQLKQLVFKEHIILSNAKINLSDLVYIKSDRHYLQLHTTDKKEFVRGKVYEILEQLPPNFIQTHRSYIVNINFAQYRTSSAIFLKNNTEIPVSRTYIKQVNELIGKKNN